MCYLGALIAGATVAPIDPEMPQDEVGRIINKSKARFILHHEDYVPQIIPDIIDSEIQQNLTLLRKISMKFRWNLIEDSLELKDKYLIQHKADILVMGDDHKGIFDTLSGICTVEYLERTPQVSTTEIIEKIHRDIWRNITPMVSNICKPLVSRQINFFNAGQLQCNKFNIMAIYV